MLRRAENQASTLASSFPLDYAAPAAPDTHPTVWVALTLGLCSVGGGFVLSGFGLPLGVAAACAGVVALARLHNLPTRQRLGEALALLGLACGVFQVVFAAVGLYAFAG